VKHAPIHWLTKQYKHAIVYHMEDRAQERRHPLSPRVTVGYPAYSIANQTNLQAAAADAMQRLIPGNELKLGNRLRRAPGLADFAPSCKPQALP
jgi:hypothetical protein